jgi:histidinol-phosphate aminotransferase
MSTIKFSGLAGLRVGYGAFPLSIIKYLWRAKQPYNVSVAAEVSACAALQNPTYLEVFLLCFVIYHTCMLICFALVHYHC